MSDENTDSLYIGNDGVPELELSDDDILDAMRDIPGYLDISTEDFRQVYHIAHRHALGRVFKDLRATQLMCTDIEPLRPDTMLDKAAATMARQGLKGLPVVDDGNRVTGILTETDYLRWLNADTFLELLLRLIGAAEDLDTQCHETPVSKIMTTRVITLGADSSFNTIVGAFHAHEGRGMPVVDSSGKLLGMLLRKDFLGACHLEGLL